MSITLLGGVAKGLRLKVPPGHTIRPMAAPLKRRLFDRLQDFAGVWFVDLCAGSGSVGLEACSRRAQHVWLNEKAPRVFALLQENAKALQAHLDSIPCPLSLSHGPAQTFLKRWMDVYQLASLEQRENTILFLAPPYPDHSTYRQVISSLQADGRFCGQLWVESDQQKGLSEREVNQFLGPPLKRFQQGTTWVQIHNF